MHVYVLEILPPITADRYFILRYSIFIMFVFILSFEEQRFGISATQLSEGSLACL